MSNLNDFNREAKAALRVALQWLLLAVPTGLVCGAVGTAFHLSVEYVTELRAAQSWLLLCLPLAGLAIVALYKVTKCEGVGTNNVIRAVQSGEPVSLLLVPAIFLGTVLTHLFGGSADLAPSNKTNLKGEGDFSKADYSGKNLHFGVREQAMTAIGNGLVLHGGVIPYVATFFVFSDYMKPIARLSSLMKVPLIYVLTHDSIGVGEDGPTHEPIEQLAMLTCAA